MGKGERNFDPGLWKILQRITGGALLYPPCIPLGIPGMKQLAKEILLANVRVM